MAKRRIGPFELGDTLGVGGMGVVYHATYLKTGQHCALKVLTPALSADKKLLRRFEREMEILKKLRHKNIVKYFGGGTKDGQHFYAMEMMSGGTLDEVLRRKQRISWERVIDCGREICKGLEYAHKAGIVHRDLKPANLFLSGKGHLKIGDFGIARDTTATALTAAGSTVGTYAYMAPEQITGKKPVSRKTDLYALGCVLYELLTGRTPFVADSMPDMLMQHLRHEAPSLRSIVGDCPVWFEALIEKLLEKEPEDRYYDALAVQVALEEVGRNVAEQKSVMSRTIVSGTKQTVAAPGTVHVERKPRKKKKKKKPTGEFYEQTWFLGSCLALLVGLVVWWSWPLNEQQLFERAKELMASTESADWSAARDKYITPLLEKYPESEHKVEAQSWIDRIEMTKLESQITSRRKRERDPQSVSEAQYREALNLREFGDLALAEAKLLQLTDSLRGEDEHRAMYLLAERDLNQVQEQWAAEETQLSSKEFVHQQLREAEEFFQADNGLKAQAIWRKVKDLYKLNNGYVREVQWTDDRLQGRNVPPLDEYLKQEESEAVDS